MPLFADWVKHYLDETHVYLEEHGVAPDSLPEERERAEAGIARAGSRAMLIFIGVAVLIVLAVYVVVMLTV